MTRLLILIFVLFCFVSFQIFAQEQIPQTQKYSDKSHEHSNINSFNSHEKRTKSLKRNHSKKYRSNNKRKNGNSDSISEYFNAFIDTLTPYYVRAARYISDLFGFQLPSVFGEFGEMKHGKNNKHEDLISFYESFNLKKNSTIYRSFKRIDFSFASKEEEDNYISNKYYRNVVPTGLKVDSDNNVYVSFPRWKEHVPFTLAKFDPENDLFVPYPSEEMTNGKANFSLNSVLGFEINPDTNTMYILDQGTLDGEGNMKLIIWDMTNNVSMLTYQFKDQVDVRFESSFLNDLVINSDDDIIYISDSGKPINDSYRMTPAIIRMKLNPSYDDDGNVVSYNESNVKVSRFLEEHDSVMPTEGYVIKCKDCDSITPTGVDGIALSCDFERLYWTPMSSNLLYGVDVIYFDYEEYLNDTVVLIGDKKSSSDGFICSNNQRLHMTMLESYNVVNLFEGDTAYALNNLQSPSTFPYPVNSSIKDTIYWPDTLSLDGQGNMWVMSNNLGKFLKDKMDFENDENYFIYTFHVGGESYILGCKGKIRRVGLLEIIVMSTGIGVFILGLITVMISTWCYRFIEKRSQKTESYFEHDNLDEFSVEQ